MAAVHYLDGVRSTLQIIGIAVLPRKEPRLRLPLPLLHHSPLGSRALALGKVHNVLKPCGRLFDVHRGLYMFLAAHLSMVLDGSAAALSLGGRWPHEGLGLGYRFGRGVVDRIYHCTRLLVHFGGLEGVGGEFDAGVDPRVARR